ncbi:Type IV pilus biogenesis and competence protein PilQ precursor [compost metagenome]
MPTQIIVSVFSHFKILIPRQFGPISYVCYFSISLLLSGCAAQMAYRDGQQLVAAGKSEESLIKFQEALEKDPREAEYKLAYIQTRNKLISDLVSEGEHLARSGNSTEAEKVYRRALSIDPNSERARVGLQMIEVAIRHALIYKEAEDAWAKKETAIAQEKLRTILAEEPKHEKAIALNKIIQATIKKNVTTESFLAAAYRKPITIEFKDVALKQLFEVISRVSGLNFVFDKDVKADQKTSIFLKNSNIESAIHFALLSNQLEIQILDANTILIYPNTSAKLKDYQELLVKTFFLTNADAKSVANTLKTILKSKDIVIDEKLNMVIVRDSPEAIRLAEKLVSLHDVAEPEVMLEVEILEVKRTRLLELGVRWPETLSLSPLPSTSGGTLTVQDIRNLNGSRIGVAIPSTKINVRKEDSDTKILANPRIRARNHEKAKIMIGDRIPNITTTSTATGFVSESINYLDVGLKLEVQPTIYLDNDVGISISLEVSNIVSQFQTKSGSFAYQIGTRNATTVLRLKDGENQVLAGLINDEDRQNANKVPGLGEIPVIGRLFGSTNNDNQKTEIVLSITPRLVRNIRRPESTQSEFRSGTDSSFRIRPDTVSNPVAPSPVKTDVQSPELVIPHGSSLDKEKVADLSGGKKPAAVVGEHAQLDWQGPSSIKSGDTFSVQLQLQSGQPITSLPLVVGFDNKVLQVASVVEGNFLKQGNGQTSFASRVSSDGQILITGTRSGSGGAASLGSVATITFRALTTAPVSSIQLVTAAATGLDGRSVEIKPPAPYTLRVE